MKLFLGVDGGQSSTIALIADVSGQVLGTGRAGPCNHAAAGEGRIRFISAMKDCLESACREAGLDPDTVEFEAAALGFSGGVEDKESYSRDFVRSKRFFFSNDAEIALYGALAGAPGIIVIAGTGSIALGKNETGRVGRAGGWGYIFGDEGGAFDLVRQALRAALALEEGWGEKTQLLDLILAASGAASANALMHAWYREFDRTRIARLAPLLTQAASNGDSVATQILTDAGSKLATSALEVHRILFQPPCAADVSCAGGVFESSYVSSEFQRIVASSAFCRFVEPVYPPAAGALLKAFHGLELAVRLVNVPHIKT